MKKIFIVLFILSLGCNAFIGWVFLTKNPMVLEGEKSWVDIYSDDAAATAEFLNKHFGIKVVSHTNDNNIDYRVIKSEEGLFPYAGIMQIDETHKEKGLMPHATIYLTVKDYDKTHNSLVEDGAKVELSHFVTQGMKFGIYVIPGGMDIGVVQFGVKE